MDEDRIEMGFTQRVDPDQITISSIQADSQKEVAEAHCKTQERIASSYHGSIVVVAEKYANAAIFVALVGLVLGLVAILHG